MDSSVTSLAAFCSFKGVWAKLCTRLFEGGLLCLPSSSMSICYCCAAPWGMLIEEGLGLTTRLRMCFFSGYDESY